jgi:hypothetical protein
VHKYGNNPNEISKIQKEDLVQNVEIKKRARKRAKRRKFDTH